MFVSPANLICANNLVFLSRGWEKANTIPNQCKIRQREASGPPAVLLDRENQLVVQLEWAMSTLKMSLSLFAPPVLPVLST